MKTIQDELCGLADSDKAKVCASFFKTGKDCYGEGDIFLGIYSQQIKDVAKKHLNLSLDELEILIKNPIHDCRVCALRILVDKYKKSNIKVQKKIFDFYLDNLDGVNNWDLVDLSAWKIVGEYLFRGGNKSVLDDLAISNNMWARRVAIVSTFAFIRRGEFDYTLRIAKVLLEDDEDLIRKAVGWMLREVGKKDSGVLQNFLRENYDKMPRVTLRYAIEKLEDKERKVWLERKFVEQQCL
jgi:3-methyladenine DNA glycosylase AlkD